MKNAKVFSFHSRSLEAAGSLSRQTPSRVDEIRFGKLTKLTPYGLKQGLRNKTDA